jgi:hypothetical protein
MIEAALIVATITRRFRLVTGQTPPADPFPSITLGQSGSGLAPEKWRALFLKEEGSDGRPEANLYP